ncbi:MAG: hypothetical protein QW057_03350 [Candidatus Bathyarchaeia archaeon]
MPVEALHLSEVSSLREPFNTVYLSVKPYDTRWPTHLIEPVLKPGGFILPAQSGLNDELKASIAGCTRTAGCVPSISAGVYKLGHIVRTVPMTAHCFHRRRVLGADNSLGERGGRSPASCRPSEATINVGAHAGKFAVNCTANALCGLIGPDRSSMSQEQRDAAAVMLSRVVAGCVVVRVA